jgi:hypothetical protein
MLCKSKPPLKGNQLLLGFGNQQNGTVHMPLHLRGVEGKQSRWSQGVQLQQPGWLIKLISDHDAGSSTI